MGSRFRGCPYRNLPKGKDGARSQGSTEPRIDLKVDDGPVPHVKNGIQEKAKVHQG